MCDYLQKRIAWKGKKEGAADRSSVDTSLAIKLHKKENLILLKLTFILKQMPFLALFFSFLQNKSPHKGRLIT